MQIVRPSIALVLLAGTVALCAQSDPVFATVGPSLRAKCAIPVLLPEILPDIGQGKDRVYAVVEKASRTDYRIILGFTPDCNGASFCRLGILAGTAAGGSALQGKPVRLADGLQGFFKQATCGAGCSDSLLSWREGHAIYSAGLKGAKISDVVLLANAMIQASKR